jgi:hypothetical protein
MLPDTFSQAASLAVRSKDQTALDVLTSSMIDTWAQDQDMVRLRGTPNERRHQRCDRALPENMAYLSETEFQQLANSALRESGISRLNQSKSQFLDLGHELWAEIVLDNASLIGRAEATMRAVRQRTGAEQPIAWVVRAIWSVRNVTYRGKLPSG